MSGGNLYNRRLLEALEHRPIEVDVLSPVAARVRLDQGAPGFYLVDSLLLQEVPKLTANAASSQHVFMLTHYLPSLEPRHASPEAVAREQELLRGLTGFVVTSDSMKGALRRRNESRPIIVIPPALVNTPSKEELACRRPGVGQFHGLIVANLSPVKGVLEFLYNLSLVLSDDDSYTIDIVGRLDLEHDYASACQSLVAQSVLLSKSVHFRGVLPPDDLRSFYLSSSVFISASEMESYGMALHEARVFGLPVLAVDAGNVSMHVPSANVGVLYRSTLDLVQGCLEFMRDPGKLSLLGQTAFDHRLVDRYSWDDAAKSLIAQIESWSNQLT